MPEFSYCTLIWREKYCAKFDRKRMLYLEGNNFSLAQTEKKTCQMPKSYHCDLMRKILRQIWLETEVSLEGNNFSLVQNRKLVKCLNFGNAHCDLTRKKLCQIWPETDVLPEGNDFGLVQNILQVGCSTVQRHLFDGLGCLSGVLEMTTQIWTSSFGCFGSIIGFGSVSSHDFNSWNLFTSQIFQIFWKHCSYKTNAIWHVFSSVLISSSIVLVEFQFCFNLNFKFFHKIFRSSNGTVVTLLNTSDGIRFIASCSFYLMNCGPFR